MILLVDPSWYNNYLAKIENVTVSEAILKDFFLASGKQNNAFVKQGNKAIIPIEGMLTKTPDFLYMLFVGANTSYDLIIEAIAEIEKTKSIKSSELHINSPGGEWTGLTEAMDAIASAKKPIVARATGMVTSAAYGLASQADKIVASSVSNEFGSIGVATRAFNTGGRIKLIRSSNAPNKNPDGFTDEGEKEIVRNLDEIENLFVSAVAKGRAAATNKQIIPETIFSNYGQGSVFLADESLRRGMIDEIDPAPSRVSNSNRTENLTNIGDTQLTTIPFDDSLTFVDRPWDATRAERGFRTFTGSQDGPNNTGAKNRQYKNYFSWYDSAKQENFGAYKLPICEVISSRRVVNVAAVRNALARLPQATTIPAGDKPGIRNNLRRYLDKYNKQKQQSNRGAYRMNEELKGTNPDFDSIYDAGRRDELSRVLGHLKLGKSTGSVDFAIKCIEEGSSIRDDAVLAEYMANLSKSTNLASRQKDNPPSTGQGAAGEGGQGDGLAQSELTDDEKAEQLLEEVMVRSKESFQKV